MAWYTYTHESRLALLASSTAAPVRLTGYQFATSGLIRLPKFDLPTQSSPKLPRRAPHPPSPSPFDTRSVAKQPFQKA